MMIYKLQISTTRAALKTGRNIIVVWKDRLFPANSNKFYACYVPKTSEAHEPSAVSDLVESLLEILF